MRFQTKSDRITESPLKFQLSFTKESVIGDTGIRILDKYFSQLYVGDPMGDNINLYFKSGL